jgi:hypothetical protein
MTVAEDKLKFGKAISEMVGIFTDPIVTCRGNLNRPPGFFMEVITLERLIMNMEALKGKEIMAGDAEASWYISSASLEAPLDEEWTRIYMYCFTKTMRACKREVPADCVQETLSKYEMDELIRLKRWIYKVQSERRHAADIQERREEREQKKKEETVKKEEKVKLQPALFDF